MASDRTHDISNTPFHVRDIKALGEILTNAAEAAFPNRGVSRYKEVHTLLLSWEDDNLGVADEIDELRDVFRNLYSFEAEEWKIPSKRSHNSLAAKVLGFLDDYESKDNLLIVYYGGHGEMNDDRQCVWSWLVRLFVLYPNPSMGKARINRVSFIFLYRCLISKTGNVTKKLTSLIFFP